VILAGGVGSRFWPVSTPARPKQLLPLASERPLIRDTVDRIVPLVPPERLRILTGPHLAGPILDALPELGPGNLLLEPAARGTAPVLAWAAAEIERRDPDAVMVSLHSDHVIHPPEAFRALIARAAELAEGHRRLFTIGVVPTRAETGYGYIRVGDALHPLEGEASGEGGGFEVAEFVEKPDRATAEGYLASGAHLWNTGLFVWRASDLLDEMERVSPELAELVPIAREGGTEEFFARAPTIAIDHAVLERSRRVGVVRATFSWDDVGAWDALARTRGTPEGENCVVGDAFAIDTTATTIYAEDGPVVAFGVEGLVIVRTNGITFVAHRDRLPELKALLSQLPARLRNL
jgi:mannose-1-phosphate guanylyltransferase